MTEGTKFRIRFVADNDEKSKRVQHTLQREDRRIR